MTDKTKIEWTEATWNPVAGCTIVSPGCTNCYAMAQAARCERFDRASGFEGGGKYGGLTRQSGGRPKWTGEVRLWPPHLDQPERWRRPRTIFVNSMSDLHHEGLGDDEIGQVWSVMERAHHHTYQVLTKRPERMAAFLATRYGDRPVAPHISIGTWCESADYWERVDWLRRIPAAVRFVSFEPLLGDATEADGCKRDGLRGIHWAIVGGESGPLARPMDPDWARAIRDACEASGTAFFFKQWGQWGSDGIKRPKGANGRLLDGREWNDTPDRSAREAA